MADFIEEIGHGCYGSPSWTHFALLTIFHKKPEPVLGNEKGHTLFGYGLENLAPRSGRT
jgi:hypothetical protein